MYGYEHVAGIGERHFVKNEIAFHNLIAVANNEILFNALDEETKRN